MSKIRWGTQHSAKFRPVEKINILGTWCQSTWYLEFTLEFTCLDISKRIESGMCLNFEIFRVHETGCPEGHTHGKREKHSPNTGTKPMRKYIKNIHNHKS